MPDSLQGNIGVHEPNIIVDINADVLAAGVFFPQNTPLAAALTTAVPFRTYGWTRVFGTIGADQPLNLRIFGARWYSDATNRVLRLLTSDVQASHLDAQTLVNVISFEFELSTPFMLYDIQNTAGFPTTFLDIYIGFRV